MSIEVVGNEILPNLYVKNIELQKGVVFITLAAFDYINENGKVIWMVKDFIRNPRISLNLITSRQGSQLDTIFKSGEDYNLFSIIKKIPKTPGLDHGSLIRETDNIQTKPIKLLSGQIEEKLKNASLDSFVEINHTFAIEIQKLQNIEEMNCYCFFSYDTSGGSLSYFTDAEGTEKKLLNGPIFSESIILKGNVNTRAMLFTYETLGYAGPLHLHEENYMEGSFHQEESHRNIDASIVNNTKISVVNYEDMLSPKNLTSTTNNTNIFFGDPIINIRYNKLSGFFRFKTEEFFKSKLLYNYFVNSFASLNMVKIRDNLRMKVDGPANKAVIVPITEILMNSVESNDMWFYFEIPNFFVGTSFNLNIEFNIIDINSIFKQNLIDIREKSNASMSKIQTSLAQTDGNTVEINNSSKMLEYIKNYCTLISMFYNVDLGLLKQLMVGSLYKSRVSKKILQKYNNSFTSLINSLSEVISNNPDTVSSIYQQNYTKIIQLENFKNSIEYLPNAATGDFVVDPQTLYSTIAHSNKVTTGSQYLFSNLEQLLLPLFVRDDNGVLQPISWNDLQLAHSYLNVLQPSGVVTYEEDVSIDYDGSHVTDVNYDNSQTSEGPGTSETGTEQTGSDLVSPDDLPTVQY